MSYLMTRWDPTVHLSTEPYCETCCPESSEFHKLFHCSRCHSAWYCSVDCQKEDYPNHKEYCLEYKKLQNIMKKEEIKLREQNYFLASNIGHFWLLWETREYCRARYAFAEHILHRAHYSDLKSLYNVGLSHYMELLRLIHSDNIGIRYEVPFILLTLNRDNDAYNFIKWWMTIDPDGRYNWGNVPKNTKKGDWLYLKNQNIYEDILETTKTTKASDLRFIDLNFLAALTLIKMRIICKFNLYKVQIKELKKVLKLSLLLNQYKQYKQNKKYLKKLGLLKCGNTNCLRIKRLKICTGCMDQSYCRKLCQKSDWNIKHRNDCDTNIISNIVQLYLSGYTQQFINNIIPIQTKYADQYLSQMVTNNKVFVKALMNPGPLRKQPYPSCSSIGSNEEAYLVINRCCRLFLRTPGAKTMIENKVGKHPTYNPKFGEHANMRMPW